MASPNEGERSKSDEINIVIIVLVSLLYTINTCVIKSYAKGKFGYFFYCYFNDIISTPFILSYVNLLLQMVNVRITDLRRILLFCLVIGYIWEYITPLLKPSSVSDPIDILCYLGGGIIYWCILRIIEER